ncbi:STAS-like domain-containing protein [Sphingomonas aurantiaca]|uniref:STAS-like domain-containing protein n=1 Tax=Sphingomonas aurantiaca TaxID=185949 RepID=UPI003A5C70A6
MVIVALDHVPHCYSHEDGAVIYGLVASALKSEQRVTLSLAGVTDVPSSFVNAALVPLLDRYEFDEIKQRLVIADATKTIADVVRRCFGATKRPPRMAA